MAVGQGEAHQLQVLDVVVHVADVTCSMMDSVAEGNTDRRCHTRNASTDGSLDTAMHPSLNSDRGVCCNGSLWWPTWVPWCRSNSERGTLVHG